MKPFWQSKTLWVNLVMAAAAFFPAISDKLDVDTVATLFAGVNTILRTVSNEKISLK